MDPSQKNRSECLNVVKKCMWTSVKFIVEQERKCSWDSGLMSVSSEVLVDITGIFNDHMHVAFSIWTFSCWKILREIQRYVCLLVTFFLSEERQTLSLRYQSGVRHGKKKGKICKCLWNTNWAQYFINKKLFKACWGAILLKLLWNLNHVQVSFRFGWCGYFKGCKMKEGAFWMWCQGCR